MCHAGGMSRDRCIWSREAPGLQLSHDVGVPAAWPPAAGGSRRAFLPVSGGRKARPSTPTRRPTGSSTRLLVELSREKRRGWGNIPFASGCAPTSLPRATARFAVRTHPRVSCTGGSLPRTSPVADGGHGCKFLARSVSVWVGARPTPWGPCRSVAGQDGSGSLSVAASYFDLKKD